MGVADELDAIKDSLGELWIVVDGLKARVESLESRMDVLDDETCVTMTDVPVFLTDSWYGVLHD